MNGHETIKFMLCFPEVFQQIMAGIKLTFKMQRTENEFDAERRIPRPRGHVIWLTSFPGSSPTRTTERGN